MLQHQCSVASRDVPRGSLHSVKVNVPQCSVKVLCRGRGDCGTREKVAHVTMRAVRAATTYLATIWCYHSVETALIYSLVVQALRVLQCGLYHNLSLRPDI